MLRRSALIIAGVILGAVMAALCPSIYGREESPAWPRLAKLGRGGLQDETRGRLAELVVHYVPEMSAELAPIYSQLFASLEPHTRVYVTVESQEDFDALMKELHSLARPLRPQIVPVIAGRRITGWSKDRFLAWIPEDDRDDKSFLLVPPPPVAGRPSRYGDWHVPARIAAASEGRLGSVRIALRFDGGDFAAGRDAVLAGPCLLKLNPGLKSIAPDLLEKQLEELAGRKVILLPGGNDGVPDHHVNMFALPLDEKKAMVGDIRLAIRLLGGRDKAQERLAGLNFTPDLSEEYADRFDNAAELLQERGFEVIRVPVIPENRPEPYRPMITYTNAFIEETGPNRSVYLPLYGVQELDLAACNIWENAGFTVRGINVGGIWHRSGSLDCLVGVLTRRPDR